VVLNREQDKALRVLLEKGLIGLFRLNCWRNNNGLLCLDFLDGLLDLDLDDWRVGVERRVLLASSLELQLLGRRLAHLKPLNAGGGLERNIS
jgi:hypothetical protein